MKTLLIASGAISAVAVAVCLVQRIVARKSARDVARMTPEDRFKFQGDMRKAQL